MVRRSASVRRHRPVEAERKQVQCLDEGVDHLNRVVRIHPVLEAFGQEENTANGRPLDKTTHPHPPASQQEDAT